MQIRHVYLPFNDLLAQAEQFMEKEGERDAIANG
jgi:hypothetical protein